MVKDGCMYFAFSTFNVLMKDVVVTRYTRCGLVNKYLKDGCMYLYAYTFGNQCIGEDLVVLVLLVVVLYVNF